MRVRGVGSECSDLLEEAGLDTVKELRTPNAANLTIKMAAVNSATVAKTKKSIVRRVPVQSRCRPIHRGALDCRREGVAPGRHSLSRSQRGRHRS